jgi:hypothetical protein
VTNQPCFDCITYYAPPCTRIQAHIHGQHACTHAHSILRPLACSSIPSFARSPTYLLTGHAHVRDTGEETPRLTLPASYSSVGTTRLSTVYTTVRQGRGSPPPTADTDRERKREETDPDARDYKRAALPVRPPRRDQPARAKGCESEPQEQQAEQTWEHDQRISSEWCTRDIRDAVSSPIYR